MENYIKKKQIKCIVSGGKTGGHLIPGIAVYEELKKNGIEVKYILNATDVKFPVVDRIAVEDRIFVNISSISRKISFRTFIDIIKLLKTFFSVFGKIKIFNPDFVIITGGYISNPVALSAILLFKPLYILEQNSIAGITNRFYSIFARKIFTSFEATKKIPSKKSEFTGNPILFTHSVERSEAKKFFGIEGDFVLGITTGSQGARVVNDVVYEIVEEIPKEISVIWSIGAVEFERFKREGYLSKLENLLNVKFYPFIERMDLFYSIVDMLISRAGATTIAEIMNFKIPTIFIPIKNSPDNHQFLNANTLVQKGLAFLIEEDKFSKETLIEKINLMKNRIVEFKSNFSKIKPLSGKRPQQIIVEKILSLER